MSADDLRQIAAEAERIIRIDPASVSSLMRWVELAIDGQKCLRRLLDQLEALARRQAPAGWQDIATAPKGTWMLVLDEEGEYRVCQQVRPDQFRDGMEMTVWRPTVWMPLPDPPAALPGAPKE